MIHIFKIHQIHLGRFNQDINERAGTPVNITAMSWNGSQIIIAANSSAVNLSVLISYAKEGRYTTV